MLYCSMARVIRPSVCQSINIMLFTTVTTDWINFNFNDIVHIPQLTHHTGHLFCRPLDMRMTTQLMIIEFYFSRGHLSR